MKKISNLSQFAAVALLFAALGQQMNAADVTWTGGFFGTNISWRTATNWSTGNQPGASDNAIFDSVGTVTVCSIDMTAAGGTQQVGCVTLGSGRSVNLAIRPQSTSGNGVLLLNSANGILLSNESTVTLTLSNANVANPPLLGIQLATSGAIYVASGVNVNIGASITGPGGFTKTGVGTLFLAATNGNSYTGDTTNLQGKIRVNADATIGSGSGTFYMSGGDLIANNTRAGAPIANPIVLTADANIYGDSAQASERILPLSGTLSGSAGSLIVGNRASVANSTFTLRLLGSYSFGRPISIGSGADSANSFKILELYNSATNGTGIQTFSGNISGDGLIRRTGATSSAGGTSILTGDNTYSGGTTNTYGTLLLNNAAGSGSGSGPVTVTGSGVFGGSGYSSNAVYVGLNGTISPGAAAGRVGSFTVDTLTLDQGAKYLFQVTNVTGAAGTAYDRITANTSWTETANSTNPITIVIDSLGTTPTGWNPGVSRDWTIIQSSSGPTLDTSHFTVDTISAFTPGSANGSFNFSIVSGSLHLIYTPAPDIVLDVAAGQSKTQAQLGYSTISGTFGVLKIGAGEAVMDNTLNDYAGSTKIYGGTLSIAADALNGSGTLGAANSAVLLGNTTGNTNVALNINTAGVTLGRSVAVQSGSTGTKTIGTTLTSGAANYIGDVVLQDNVILTATNAGTAAFSGQFSGVGGITKVGSGIISLTNTANTFLGKVRILEGTLSIDAVNRLGALPTNNVDDQVTLNGGTLEFTASTTASGSARGFKLDTNGGRFSVIGGTLSLSGPVSGPGNLVKTGGNRLELNNPTNTYSGDTILVDGEIGMDDDGSLGIGTIRFHGGALSIQGSRSTTANFLPNTISMTNDARILSTGGTLNSSRVAVFSGSSINTSGGTLTITNGAATVTNNTFDVRLVGGGFNFTQPIVLDSGIGVSNSAQLFLGNSNASSAQVFSGVISGNGKVRRSAVVSSDAGKTIFTAANTYSGGTIVFSGTLLVNNTSGSGTGTGSVIVTNVGTLGGTGTIAGTVSVLTNGIIAPGGSVGALTLQNGLDLSASGTYLWELGSNSTSSAGVNFDQIVVTGGNLALGGTSKIQLVFTNSATAPNTSDSFWQSAHSWRVISLGGGTNPGNTIFGSIVNGSSAAGVFSTSADAGGILLTFTPGPTSQPVISKYISNPATTNTTISWSAQNGVTYEVQYKSNLNQSVWLTLGTVSATNSTASFTDTTGPAPERYYRLIIP